MTTCVPRIHCRSWLSACCGILTFSVPTWRLLAGGVLPSQQYPALPACFLLQARRPRLGAARRHPAALAAQSLSLPRRQRREGGLRRRPTPSIVSSKGRQAHAYSLCVITVLHCRHNRPLRPQSRACLLLQATLSPASRWRWLTCRWRSSGGSALACWVPTARARPRRYACWRGSCTPPAGRRAGRGVGRASACRRLAQACPPNFPLKIPSRLPPACAPPRA